MLMCVEWLLKPADLCRDWTTSLTPLRQGSSPRANHVHSARTHTAGTGKEKGARLGILDRCQEDPPLEGHRLVPVTSVAMFVPLVLPELHNSLPVSGPHQHFIQSSNLCLSPMGLLC